MVLAEGPLSRAICGPSGWAPPLCPKGSHRTPLQEVVNGYHATSVSKTFGGITARHIWNGIISLTPAEAAGLGFQKPPDRHDFAAPPDGADPSYNSWAIVPVGHILSHVANLPAAAPIDTGSQAQLSQLATLEGEDFEMAVAKLAPAERRRLMDSAN